MTPLDPRQIAKVMGGDVINRSSVNVPGPRNSKSNHSLSIKAGANVEQKLIEGLEVGR